MLRKEGTTGGPAPATEAVDEGRNPPLGVTGFHYGDLHDLGRLPDLLRAFDDDLKAQDPEAWAALARYRLDHERMAPTEVSSVLVRVAPWVSRFVGRLFGVERGLADLAVAVLSEESVMRYRRDFVQRRLARRFGPAGKEPCPPLSGPDVSWPEDLAGLVAAADPEKALAEHVCRLLDREKELAGAGPADEAALAGTRARIAEAELFTGALLGDARRGPSSRYHAWPSLRLPMPVAHDRLVPVIRPKRELASLTMGPVEHRRRRDGFKLTDPRMTHREALAEVHYCIYCHDRDKDSCSKGFALDGGGFRPNPLGIPLTGCPLDEKISEAHLMQSGGDTLAALALITIDNPMLPGTGHRICNDCMKACIYQKQDPVNIPQIETRILSDVLALPYGFEIWSLLTRWNPLNVARPHALPYNGVNVLVVGLGPAGYTLTHHLANEGFAVAGIDGLKLEPLPADLTGADGAPPRPIREVVELYRELDDRPLTGFGGVSEYGITVRWDKNFLAVLYLNLARRPTVRMYGGIRFGGTLTAAQAFAMGFDHIAIASGAGKPTIIDMKNNLVRGVRKASDFLMALQLTGAFKRDALANLQVRLPALVIGGGLTAIDTATELLAYYPIQVEKTLHRYETLAAKHGEAAIRVDFRPEELEILDEHLDHGRQVRAERARALQAGEKPDLARLVQQWGGVTICYRKTMKDSPAYRLNHEEVIKALEEGISFAERLTPVEAIPDEHGHLKEMILKHDETGSMVTLAARSCMVAAGTSPNVTYEKEHEGTFALDERRHFFRSFRAELGEDGVPVLLPAGKGEVGFFTSHNDQGRLISFFGDNHPRFAGNVVKAMASAREGAPHVTAVLSHLVAERGAQPGPKLRAQLEGFWRLLDEDLLATVEEVRRLTPTIIEVVVHAPRQARNFRPGQFFRLQNYESHAPVYERTPLLIEPLALTGAWVDVDRGLLSLIALELGSSSRLCGTLKKGEPVVVMGPTGAPTEIVPGETVLLAGGGLGNAVLFSIAKGMKEAGCRVIYFAGYKKPGDFFKREDIEAHTDIVIYSVDKGEPIPTRRPQDRSVVGNIVQAMLAYAHGSLGEQPIRLDECDRIITIGSDVMMAAVARARHAVLAPLLKPGHVAIASINSPMQCMMKEVCAQCLQQQLGPDGAPTGFVFTCFNQDQAADCVDWAHLNQRLRQNTAQEKLTNLWLERLLTLGEPDHIAR